jgi:glycerol-3-phosphate acyltransferase PlsY
MTGSSGILIYLLIPISYLVGSIPFGIIISRPKGIDLRSSGSGNIGATNVLRSVGKLPALFTLIADILKGAVPLMLLSYLSGGSGMPSFEVWGGVIGLAAVLGHLFPVFLSFKGGKGVATGLGVMLVYSPAAMLMMVLVWLSSAALFRYSSLAAIAAFTSLPAIIFFIDGSLTKVSFALILSMLIIIRHSSNIKRLINGTESRIGSRG